MKRQRNTRPCSAQPRHGDETTQISGPSITDLPSTIIIEIFLKLPTKSIAVCKSACKAWRALISDREFVKIHFAHSKDCTLIRNADPTKFSRSFYLLEEEDYVSGFCRCIVRNSEKCKQCEVNTPVKAQLKSPLRNPQDFLSRLVDSNIDYTMFCTASKSKSKSKSKNVVKMTSIGHRDGVSNSCNGLLCLFKSDSFQAYYDDMICDIRAPIVVCNPVTGEFMHLPNSWKAQESRSVSLKTLGLGFSPERNEYKVIRVHKWRSNPGLSYVDVAEIHTLGTKSWRKLDLWGTNVGSFEYPAYLDGVLYWILLKEDEDHKMVSFDLNDERFQLHSLPFQLYERPEHAGPTLRAFGGRLYMLDGSDDTHVHIWVMNENGNHEYWTKLFSMDVSKLNVSDYWSGVEPEYYQILYVNKEAVVMFNHLFGEEFIYYDRLEGPRFKRLKFRGCRSDTELTIQVIAYTPSFISLKDIVGQAIVEVFNINSGCGMLKLLEETHPLLLGGPKPVV